MAQHRPGAGFLGWLGRQVGHVKKAIETDVSAPVTQTPPTQTPAPQVVFRRDTVQHQPLPGQPDVTLRRTVIDEVIVANKALGTTASGGASAGPKPSGGTAPK